MIYNDIIFNTVDFDKFQIDELELSARLGDMVNVSQLKEYIDKYNSIVNYKYAYARIDVQTKDDKCIFDFSDVESKALSKVLKDLKEVIIMVLSSGLEVDRLISRAFIKSQVEGFILDAIASAGIESFADYITNVINENIATTNRFSPGYADLPMEFQEPLLNRLNASKTVGISLTDKYIMIPSKSITAIMGIKQLEGTING